MSDKIKRAKRKIEYPVRTEVEILTPLDYRDLLNGKDVKLLSHFRVKLIEHYRDGTIEIRIITVEKDFISDLASVPWLFQRTFPRFGPWNAAAVVHDWIFITGKIEGRPVTRETADRVFLAIMQASGCGWRSYPMYVAVRIGGKWLWERNRGNDKK
ncbi:MAG: DUF1353 domain-containing protein [Kiritimatiellia bacterium]|nr:DUF1353 domain-containing protein [Kiritimatiellia bacterium]